MTKLLALEASSEACSVTLSTPKVCKSLVGSEPRSHSQLLLPYIDSLLSLHKVKLADLDFIACSQGPGSFTGLRICFSVAQGLAYGASIPVITVCSLESMAMLSQLTYLPTVNVTIAIIDARMNQVYWAAFQHNGTERGGASGLDILIAPQLQFIDEARTQMELIIQQHQPSAVAIVGSGVHLLQSEGLNIDDSIVDTNIMPTSEMSAKLALVKWGQGLALSPGDAELVYLRDTITWKKRTKIRPV